MSSPRLKSLKLLILILAQIGLVGYLDYLTGIEVGFSVFYFIPVAYAAWHLGVAAAIAASLLCAGVWYAVDVLGGHTYTFFLMGIWNGLVRLISFLLLGYTTGKLKEQLIKEKELSTRLQESMDQVRELRGLLPICAACKRIRNDTGYWEQIENYISKHSRAEFSHSICPDCAGRLYPEIFDRRQTESRPPAADNGHMNEKP